MIRTTIAPIHQLRYLHKERCHHFLQDPALSPLSNIHRVRPWFLASPYIVLLTIPGSSMDEHLNVEIKNPLQLVLAWNKYYHPGTLSLFEYSDLLPSILLQLVLTPHSNLLKLQ